MQYDYIHLVLGFKPIPWARPAGKSARYDSQLADKNAFGLLTIEQLNERYNERNWDALAGSNFPNNVGVSVDVIFTIKDTRKKNTKNQLEFPLPDIDNMAKFTLDALQSGYLEGIIWDDDKQVVKLSALKQYGTVNRTEIIINKLINS